MIKDFPQFVSQEVCLSCDGCCRFAEKNSSWRPKVAREKIDECYRQELDEDGYIKATERRGRIQCVFFQPEDHTCHVYERRPFECRLYPFLLMRKGDDVAVGVHLSCPYIQEKWQETEFRHYVEELQRYFQKQEVLEFIRRNQELLGNYSGCEQEVERLFELPL